MGAARGRIGIALDVTTRQRMALHVRDGRWSTAMRLPRPRALHVETLGLPTSAGRLPVDHVVTPEQLPWRGTRAYGPFFEGHHPIDNCVAYPFRFLDDATLATWEIRGIHRAVILQAQLRLIIDDNVGCVPLLQDPPVCESSNPGWQTTQLVMGFLQTHDVLVSDPCRQEIDRPGAQGLVARVGPTVRDTGMGIGVIHDLPHRLGVCACRGCKG